MRDIKPSHSLFLGLMGGPYKNDLTTNFFRLLPVVLEQGCNVTVWTCGNATSITSRLLQRPSDPIHPAGSSQHCAHSLSAMARAMLAEHPKRLRWLVCQYCMEERGATEQIEGTEIMLPFSFDTYLHQADQALVMGTK